MKKFSIVIPVRDSDRELLKKTLPSWIALESDDLILCIDFPPDSALIEVIWSINKGVKILPVTKNESYCFQQAYIRRAGFKLAKYSAVLTGDADLVVYSSCLKAIELVGKDNVGLVSLSKLRNRRNFIGKLQTFTERLVRVGAKLLGHYVAGGAYFTGLYCIHKPFWLDSEEESSIKQLKHPYEASLSKTWGGYVGEDTHLRNCMIKKHKVLYLSEIGAEDLRPGLEERKIIQYKIGMSFARQRRKFTRVLLHVIIHIRPYVLIGYLCARLR